MICVLTMTMIPEPNNHQDFVIWIELKVGKLYFLNKREDKST